jgi:hypothetical protein
MQIYYRISRFGAIDPIIPGQRPGRKKAGGGYFPRVTNSPRTLVFLIRLQKFHKKNFTRKISQNFFKFLISYHSLACLEYDEEIDSLCSDVMML